MSKREYDIDHDILLVITMKEHSHRLPNKNRMVLGGKPLLQWSLDTLDKAFPHADLVIITDDEVIKKWLTRDGGYLHKNKPGGCARERFLLLDEPEEMTLEHSPGPLTYAWKTMEDLHDRQYPFICNRELCAPFAKPSSARLAASLAIDNDADWVGPVLRHDHRWFMKEDEVSGDIVPLEPDYVLKVSGEDPTYQLTSGAHIFKRPKGLSDGEPFGLPGMFPGPVVCVDWWEGINLDTLADLQLAQMYLTWKYGPTAAETSYLE